MKKDKDAGESSSVYLGENLNQAMNYDGLNRNDQSSYSMNQALSGSPSNSTNENHSTELCDKIRHEIRNFTEEFKEKFIKKKNRHNVSHKKSNDSNHSSDQEEDRKCITRIKINTNDDMDFLNLNQYNGCSRNNPSPSILNSSSNLSSQNNLTESRSPFVNRALPPLPNKENRRFNCRRSFFDNSHLKASNSKSNSDQFDDESSIDKFDEKLNGKFNKKLKERFNRKQQSEDDSDEDSELNVTNCFKIYRDRKLVGKKYSHPPPHLHRSSKVVVPQYEEEDDDEEENDGNQANAKIDQQTTQSRQSNLNDNNLIDHQSTLSFLSTNPSSKKEYTCSTTNFNSSNQHNNVKQSVTDEQTRKLMDYAESIEKVKEQGWYWGPLSGEKAEKLLENEPEGSFIVRDSSDENYIFSLTFKLNNDIVHVRIEHDHGNFSFGSLQQFSSSIVDFINKAVEYSRSGRYLFFLHRLPVVGPMRVQLLNPVSRFRNVQTLKHLSRFVILKHVRRDRIASLPLPDKLIRYLNQHNYFVCES